MKFLFLIFFVLIFSCKEDPTKPDVPKICEEIGATGICRANFPRYYFNADSAKCVQFFWGGCEGNGGNPVFSTLDSCVTTCQ